MNKQCYVIGALLYTICTPLVAGLEQAPPAFEYNNSKAVFVDFTESDLDLNYDVLSKSATGSAVISFYAEETGFPIFDLIPSITHLVLNGKVLSPEQAPLIDDPDKTTKFRVIQQAVEANSQNTLEIKYNIDKKDTSFENGTVQMGFWMSDLPVGGRRYWEKYVPSNLQFDQFQQNITINITNNNAEQTVFSNGDIEQLGSSQWKIAFPSYYNTSAFYLHITDQNRFVVKQDYFQGLERDIPITVYSINDNLTNQGMNNAKKYLSELETTFGPYPHKYNISYITNKSRGGMEYAGGTKTSLSAQRHEFAHFWFARSIIPSNGNAGWIDEAIASWIGRGYPSLTFTERLPVNLGGFSPYRRHTTRAAYSSGTKLISELDGEFQEIGGMRPLLSQLFHTYKNNTITTKQFKTFLENNTGVDLNFIFDRYVYGKSASNG